MSARSQSARVLAAALGPATLAASALACSPTPGPPIPPPPVDAAAVDHADELDGICKTVAGAPPEVVLGKGQSDYLPLADLETVKVEAGPQGGHHIWMAILMKNLLRAGSLTRLTAVAPATGTMISPYEVIYTFDPAEGGYCKLFGLRFQLDLDGVDYVPLLGQELDVTATVTDASGDSGQSSRRVMLSPMPP
jgi:hypothetical protein